MREDPLVHAPTEDLPWMTLGGRQIPPWSYNRRSAEIAEDRWPVPEEPGRELKLLKYQGDVVWVALMANIATWATFGLPLWLSNKAVCANTGLATISRSYYLFFLPFIGVSMGLEVVALRRVLPSVLRITEPKLPGLHMAVRIEVYLAFMLIISIINHADVMTNGIFIARLLKTSDCDKDKYGRVRLLALVLWGAMFLLQFLYVAFAVFPIDRVVDDPSRRPAAPSNPSSNARATPLTDSDAMPSNAGATPPTDSDVVSSNAEEPVVYFQGFDFRRRGGHGENPDTSSVYRTLSEDIQTHQGSIFTSADGARWASIQNLERDYLHTFHIPRSQGSTALKALKKTVHRCYVFLFLENTLFLLTQCWVQSLTQGPVMTLSIGTGLLGGMIALYTALSTVKVYSKDVVDGYDKYKNNVDTGRKEPNAADARVPDRYRKFQVAFKFLLTAILVSYSWVLLEFLADAGRIYDSAGLGGFGLR